MSASLEKGAELRSGSELIAVHAGCEYININIDINIYIYICGVTAYVLSLQV